MKKIFSFAVLFLTGMYVNAQKLIDNINYNLNTEKMTAEVTYGDNSYTGDIIIPETITYEDATYTVTSIGGSAFQGCHDLTSIYLPQTIETLASWSFTGCSLLKEIEFPENLKSIGDYAFMDCHAFTTVTLPKTIESVGHRAFFNCYSLGALRTMNETPIELNTIKDPAFDIIYEDPKNYEYDAVLYVPAGSLDKYKEDKQWGKFNYIIELGENDVMPSVKKVEIENVYYLLNEGNNVSKVMKYDEGFDYAGDLVVKDNIEYEGVNYTTRKVSTEAFSNCDNLTSLVLPNSIKTIGDYAFSRCHSLTSVVLPSEITRIGFFTFGECSSLAEINIPETVTELGSYVFNSCSSIKSIKFPSNLKKIDYNAFEGCSALTEVVIPETVSYIGDGAFSGCSSLSNVVLPKNLEHLGDWCFNMCSSIEEMVLPSTLKKLGEGMFYDCSNLKKVNIPANVKKVGESAFGNCIYLPSIVIPAGVEDIGNFCFQNCASLESVYSEIKEPFAIMKEVFDFTQFQTLYVPEGTQELYSKTEFWNLFKNIKEGTDTGIDQITADENQEDVIFDIQGRKVVNPTEGLYIKNGKKVIL